MKGKPHRESLEREGNMDGDEKCFVEGDKDKKAGGEEKRTASPM